ncbi:transcriptional regulator [Nonomuraea mesophila]|uniref:Transcriptional regulator n=1 Tax=Nonomuraea mesophila TaxID=2530382 RepID=A0A4R5FVX3_9ACTN|nr:ArsR family transcriptional regulator [Nonomuraea mesophila]TDE57772.1 transcriptional regulator [Nonomuraea mesophila]
MYAFDILGDPLRRRILELLAEGEQTSGAIRGVIRAVFALSQPAVSQRLRVVRENGFASVRVERARRFYAVGPTSLSEVDVWLDRSPGFWDQRLDALGTELVRGRRASRACRQPNTAPTSARPIRQ